jgi:cytochrome c oxidase subunit 2
MLFSALPAIDHPDAQSMLWPTGDQAMAIDWLLSLMHWVCAIMYVLVVVGVFAVLWRAWRARSRPSTRVSEHSLQFAFRGWILLTVSGLVVLTLASFLIDRQLLSAARADLTIRIDGRQWWWRIEYRDADPQRAFVTANELHLPVSRTAHIELLSDDVIHSFWVPQLAGKRDMIPGRLNTIEVTPRRIGAFRGTCAEFCGLQHAKMGLVVVVENEADFAGWRTRQAQPATIPTAPLASAGAQVFASARCASCHSIRGTYAGSEEGPDLTHLASRATLAAGTLPFDAATLEAWIRNPQRHKPGTLMPGFALEPAQRDALVAYLLALE